MWAVGIDDQPTDSLNWQLLQGPSARRRRRLTQEYLFPQTQNSTAFLKISYSLNDARRGQCTMGCTRRESTSWTREVHKAARLVQSLLHSTREHLGHKITSLGNILAFWALFVAAEITIYHSWHQLWELRSGFYHHTLHHRHYRYTFSIKIRLPNTRRVIVWACRAKAVDPIKPHFLWSSFSFMLRSA